MAKITITINDIKAVKKLMDEVDRIKEKNLQSGENNVENYGNKEKIIKYKESCIKKNVNTIAALLNIDYDVVIDMCYDFAFAKYVLTDVKKQQSK